MSEYQDPFGRTFFESPAPDGGTYLDIAPGQYVCDFCTTPDPSWQYPCAPVLLAGNPNMTATDDEWAACERCHELIEAGDLEAMVRYMVDTQRQQPIGPGFVLPPRARQMALMRTNLRAFLRAKSGPPRPMNQ